VTQSRWRSPVVWMSIAALLAFILKSFGVFSSFGFTEDTFKEFFGLLCGVLIAFGILNNPTDKQNF
jgi:uncharacterized membrane protein